MQDRYISLDPEAAERTSAQVRSNLYWQRVEEAAGGSAGSLIATQCALAASTATYASFKSKGFALFPFAAKKTPRYATIAFMGVVGWNFGSSYVFNRLGDKAHYDFLVANKSAILRGEKSLN